jgi:hypothetical protein
MVTNDTAPVTFSDSWDTEEPTVVECELPTPAGIADWQDHTGTWTAFRDEDLRRVFTCGDDPTETSAELPVFAVAL